MLTVALALLAQERPSTLIGTFRQLPAFESKLLGNKRMVTVWLPPDYEASKASYSVLIMLDGQNLFDGAKSFIPGEEWRVDETATMLIRAKLMEPLIIVGVDNTDDRINEYTPVKTEMGGGRGDKFGRFLTTELLSTIRQRFRTKAGPASLGIAGSSLGGLISLHLGLKNPEVFGKVGGISPSVWWGDRQLLKTANAFKGRRPRIWLDIGTKESKDAVSNTLALRDALTNKGWVLGKDLIYAEEPGGEHNERAWSRRLGAMFMVLFPAR